MKFKYISLLILAWLPPGTYEAQTAHHFAPPTNTFSLDLAIGEALTNNPSLKAARTRWSAMERRIAQARAWEDPRVELDIAAGRFVNVPPSSFSDQRVAIEQPIPATGKNKLRAAAAVAEAGKSGAEFRRQKIDLTAQTRAAYFRMANAFGQWEINRRNARFLQTIANVSRGKFESGAETEASVLSAETELAGLDEAAFDFERQISEEQSALNTLMNLPPDSPLGKPLPYPFSPVALSLESIESIAAANRPELAAAERKIDAAKAALKLSQRDRIPEPNLRFEANHYNATSEPIDDFIVGVSFNLPWFNGGKYSAAIREKRDDMESAHEELESLRAETAALVRDQLKKIDTFQHHYELFHEKVAPLARQAVDASRISYEAGKGGLLEVLAAQRTAQETESMLIQHLTDYQIALAELEAIIGTPLPEITAALSEPKQENP